MKSDPKFLEKVEILKNSYQMPGLWTTVKDAAAYLLQSPGPDGFDAKYGTTTSDTVVPEDAGIEDEAVRTASNGYAPTQAKVMRHILHHLSSHDLSAFSFVDIGCGKGRAMLLASEYPFRQVLGVDASAKHCDVARSNIERFLKASNQVKCTNIQAHCEDACNFSFPNTSLVVYMYNPFSGGIVKRVIDNLSAFKQETAHKVLLAYLYPEEEHHLERHEEYVKLKEYQVIDMDCSWNLWECQTRVVDSSTTLELDAPGNETCQVSTHVVKSS